MVLVKINYASVSPIIKITYDETPVYIKTSVNNVYAKVVYGTSIKWGDIEGTLSDQTDLQNALDDKVPYTGATANVDLGEYELKAGQLTLDVSPTGTASVGTTRWNNTIGSSETTLKGGSVVLKNGVDLVARIVNKVTPNTTLTKAAYQAVRISGAQGQRLAVAFAQANNDNNSADTIGLVTETIATNQEGFIMTVGSLEGINTTGSLQGETWSDGDVLYLSPTVAGAITNIKPVAPQHLVVIGYVEYAHQNNGKIYVKVMNGWELGELHDVNTNGATNGQVLTYNGSIWVPSTNGVGTVTSVDMTVPTGLTVSGNPITSSGTLALGLASGYSIPTDANQTNWTAAYNDKINSAAVTGTTTKTLTLNQQDGGTITASWTDYDTAPVTSVFGRTGAVVATSGDYTTDQVTEGTNLYFTDARARAAISLTTTGTSGAATYISGVINVPNYTLSGLGGVPSTRTLTINGTAFDLSADRSWSVGTVTSVAALTLGTTGTDLSSSVATGTTTPVITLNVPTASATNRGALSSADWSTFNAKQNAITLTTTGTSGAATLIGATLNIPQYQAVLTNPITGTGTAGQVAYWSGTNTQTGSNNLFWDATNNRLGIGTSSPAYRLQVDGASTAGFVTPLLIKNPSTNAASAVKMAFDGGGTIWGEIGSSYNTNNPYMAFFVRANSEKMRITDGGNVAIGTLLPTSYGSYTTLCINNAGNGAVIDLLQNDIRTGSIYTSVSGAGLNINTVTSNPLIFLTANTERARFTAGGNLLVGTTTDGGQRLQVSGTASVSSSITAASFIPSSSTVPTNGMYLPSANTLGFATNSAERIRITSTGLVGIGTDAPYSNLQIQGASDTRLVVQVVGTEVAGDRAGLYFKSAIQYTDSYLKAAVIFQNNGTGFGRGDLILAVNNGAGGTNVSPSDAKLTIAANGTATFASSATATSFIPSGSTVPTNGMYLPTTNTVAWATNTTERMRLDASGNLGIGMTPSYRLDITSPSGTWEAARLTAGGNHPVLMRFVGGGGGSVDFGSDSAANVGIIRTGGNERVRIDASGNLGLGVTPSAWSASYKALQIGNSLAFLGASAAADIYFNAFFDGTNFKYISSTSASLYSLSGGQHRFYNAPVGTAGNNITFTQAMTLAATGNLLIGTTTDGGYKLDINGTARVQGDFTLSDTRNIIVGTTTGTKIGTATSQKIGFWNATPIVQPTTAVAAAAFVANTSGIANDTATFDGYTIGQVVKALRNAGILA